MSTRMNCTKCKGPIVLNPSAEDRSKQFGKPASYYIKLFSVCVACKIKSWYEGSR